MEKPSHHISIVMNMGKADRTAPTKARTSPSANRRFASPGVLADADSWTVGRVPMMHMLMSRSSTGSATGHQSQQRRRTIHLSSPPLNRRRLEVTTGTERSQDDCGGSAAASGSASGARRNTCTPSDCLPATNHRPCSDSRVLSSLFQTLNARRLPARWGRCHGMWPSRRRS